LTFGARLAEPPGAGPRKESTIVRKWIMSACTLAWLALALTAVTGLRGPSPAHASGTAVSSNANRTATTSNPTTSNPTTSNPTTSNPTTSNPTTSNPGASNPGTTSAGSASAGDAIPLTAVGQPRVILASVSATPGAQAPAARQPSPPASPWTVRPGDTLSGIAAALGLRGGWQALYAANKAVIGPDPDVIAAGTVLAVPGATPPARYTVAPGDTLSGIAAALGLRGGWQALYAANRVAIGPDPNVIHAGTVLAAALPSAPVAASPAPSKGTPPATTEPATTPAPTGAPASSGINRQSSPGHPAPSPLGTQPASGQRPSGQQPSTQQSSTQQSSTQQSSGQQSSGQPASSRPTAPARSVPSGNANPLNHGIASGAMPRWLEDVLLAVGVLAATAFIAEPAAAFARRRRPSGPAGPRPAPSAPPRGPARRAVRRAKIILADHERLIVTYSAREHAVYVLTPPGEDPAAVLRAARLILPEETYEDLAGHLGVPSGWPLE
jgi:LysM repeat protein